MQVLTRAGFNFAEFCRRKANSNTETQRHALTELELVHFAMHSLSLPLSLTLSLAVLLHVTSNTHSILTLRKLS